MPRIRADTTTITQTAKSHPREFAILSQLTSRKANYAYDAEALVNLTKSLGDQDAAVNLPKEGDVDVDLVVKALQKPAEPVDAGKGNCLGWAARDEGGRLAPFKFDRRATGENDVMIKITHVGVCHSDLHQIRNEWKNTNYPVVPGHEIVGIVVETGSAVKRFQLGDRAGVGCMVDACFSCDKCNEGEQQFCRKGAVMTYNGTDYQGNRTYGGYSTYIVVDQKCVLSIPENIPLEQAAPLLCAGITVFSPMKYYGLDKPGTKLAVMGLGGLGHMAVKLGVALGCEVTVLSRSKGKEPEAKALGAHHYLVSTDEAAMKAAAKTFNGIIDTVSADHNMQQLVDLLDADGKIVVVGVPPSSSISAAQASLLFRRSCIGGSLIGGVPETQEMLDLCGEKGIGAQVEVIPISYINTAMERLQKGDVKFRFVIDVQGTLL